MNIHAKYVYVYQLPRAVLCTHINIGYAHEDEQSLALVAMLLGHLHLEKHSNEEQDT